LIIVNHPWLLKIFKVNLDGTLGASESPAHAKKKLKKSLILCPKKKKKKPLNYKAETKFFL
jgi:hypothetical protein